MLKVHLCSPFTSVVLLNFMHAFYLHGVLSLPCGLFTPTWPFITMWDLSPPWSPPPGLGVRGALHRHYICDNFVTRHLAKMYLRKFATESIFTASIIWFYIWELDYVILAPPQASAPCSRLGALALAAQLFIVQDLRPSNSFTWIHCTARSGSWCRITSTARRYWTLLIWSGDWLLHEWSAAARHRWGNWRLRICVGVYGRHFEHLYV